MMFKSVLVANRGEIACRVFRTARRMGIRTLAVYSEADANALHVREADEAVLIGPAAARESYLVADKVLAAAKATGAEAIHPGYGFLSENADFAEAVMAAGIVWIGPQPASIRAMGLKDAAKKLMIEAGVPVTPGYQGEDQTDATLTAEAGKIGYPVLIKAVAGGGGKGMKKVDGPKTSPTAWPRPARGPVVLRRSARADREATSPARATSRCRSSATAMARSSTCTNATAPCSAATRR
jgi:3-methylcrotonyl-CoA carboxylase alpha subunit